MADRSLSSPLPSVSEQKSNTATPTKRDSSPAAASINNSGRIRNESMSSEPQITTTTADGIGKNESGRARQHTIDSFRGRQNSMQNSNNDNDSINSEGNGWDTIHIQDNFFEELCAEVYVAVKKRLWTLFGWFGALTVALFSRLGILNVIITSSKPISYGDWYIFFSFVCAINVATLIVEMFVLKLIDAIANNSEYRNFHVYLYRGSLCKLLTVLFVEMFHRHFQVPLASSNWQELMTTVLVIVVSNVIKIYIQRDNYNRFVVSRFSARIQEIHLNSVVLSRLASWQAARKIASGGGGGDGSAGAGGSSGPTHAPFSPPPRETTPQLPSCSDGGNKIPFASSHKDTGTGNSNSIYSNYSSSSPSPLPSPSPSSNRGSGKGNYIPFFGNGRNDSGKHSRKSFTSGSGSSGVSTTATLPTPVSVPVAVATPAVTTCDFAGDLIIPEAVVRARALSRVETISTVFHDDDADAHGHDSVSVSAGDIPPRARSASPTPVIRKSASDPDFNMINTDIVADTATGTGVTAGSNPNPKAMFKDPLARGSSSSNLKAKKASFLQSMATHNRAGVAGMQHLYAGIKDVARAAGTSVGGAVSGQSHGQGKGQGQGQGHGQGHISGHGSFSSSSVHKQEYLTPPGHVFANMVGTVEDGSQDSADKDRDWDETEELLRNQLFWRRLEAAARSELGLLTASGLVLLSRTKHAISFGSKLYTHLRYHNTVRLKLLGMKRATMTTTTSQPGIRASDLTVKALLDILEEYRLMTKAKEEAAAETAAELELSAHGEGAGADTGGGVNSGGSMKGSYTSVSTEDPVPVPAATGGGVNSGGSMKGSYTSVSTEDPVPVPAATTAATTAPAPLASTDTEVESAPENPSLTPVAESAAAPAAQAAASSAPDETELVTDLLEDPETDDRQLRKAALRMFGCGSGSDGSGVVVTEKQMKEVCRQLYEDSKNMAISLSDNAALRSSINNVADVGYWLFMLVISQIIMSIDPFAVLTPLLSLLLLLSFALSQILGNVFSAIGFVMFILPFDVGDRVAIGSSSGKLICNIVSVGLLTTTVVTMYNERVQIANHVLYSTNIMNLQQSKHACFELPVSFALTGPGAPTMQQIRKFWSIMVHYVEVEKKSDWLAGEVSLYVMDALNNRIGYSFWVTNRASFYQVSMWVSRRRDVIEKMVTVQRELGISFMDIAKPIEIYSPEDRSNNNSTGSGSSHGVGLKANSTAAVGGGGGMPGTGIGASIGGAGVASFFAASNPGRM